MDKWKGKVAIVTGASTGIGAGVARALVHHGMIVVGLARRFEKIQEIADELSKAEEPGKLYAMKADLRKEEEILAVFQWVDKELGGADVLVNNAGISQMAYLEDGETEDWRNMIDVNFLSVCICTREYLKSMRKRNNQNGHIIIIDSISAHIVQDPIAVLYIATKHAVNVVSKCIRRQLTEEGNTIKVTNISPGMTKTEAVKKLLKEQGPLPMIEVTDVANVVVDTLSASPVAQICELVVTPVANKYPGTLY